MRLIVLVSVAFISYWLLQPNLESQIKTDLLDPVSLPATECAENFCRTAVPAIYENFLILGSKKRVKITLQEASQYFSKKFNTFITIGNQDIFIYHNKITRTQIFPGIYVVTICNDIQEITLLFFVFLIAVIHWSYIRKWNKKVSKLLDQLTREYDTLSHVEASAKAGHWEIKNKLVILSPSLQFLLGTTEPSLTFRQLLSLHKKIKIFPVIIEHQNKYIKIIKNDNYPSGTVIDVTEYIELSNKLRIMYKACNQIHIPILLVDTTGYIIYSNNYFSKVCKDTCKLTNITTITNEINLVSKQEQQLHLLLQYKEEKLWNIVTVTPIYEKRKLCFQLVTFTDISKEKELELRLQQERDQAKIQVINKANFLANMSHELRTPLNAIIGFSEAILSGAIKGKDQEYIKIIYDSGNSLLKMINNLLMIHKIDADKYPVNNEWLLLDSCITNSINQVSILATKRENIINVDTTPILFFGDFQCVCQILVNLLGNSIKFTENGKITITVKQSQIGWELQIIDTGVGMTSTQLHQALIVMGTRNIDGTGLGLMLVRKFCQLHDIEFSIDSIVSKGTTVTLQLPNNRVRIP